MSQFGKLTLYFTQRSPDHPVRLVRTTFLVDETSETIEARNSLYGKSFKWSAGVKALSTLLVNSLSHSLQADADADAEVETNHILSGRRRSPAASLNDVLTKKPKWLFDMFGTSPRGEQIPRLAELLCRRNADFNTDAAAPVEIWLNTTLFPATRIEVQLNDRKITDPAELDQLAENVGGQCIETPKRLITPAMPEFWEWSRDYDPNEFAEGAELMAKFFSPDVTLHVQGNPLCPFLGTWTGRDRVIEAGIRNYSYFDFSERQMHTFAHTDDSVAMFDDYQCIVKDSSLPADLTVFSRFVMEEGLISLIHVVSDIAYHE